MKQIFGQEFYRALPDGEELLPSSHLETDQKVRKRYENEKERDVTYERGVFQKETYFE